MSKLKDATMIDATEESQEQNVQWRNCFMTYTSRS